MADLYDFAQMLIALTKEETQEEMEWDLYERLRPLRKHYSRSFHL